MHSAAMRLAPARSTDIPTAWRRRRLTNGLSQGQANLDNATYATIRDGLLTRFLAGVPFSLYLTLGDVDAVLNSRFLPLVDLGLTRDDQFAGSLKETFTGLIANLPPGSAAATSYFATMNAALAGARADLAASDGAYADAVVSAAATALGRDAAKVQLAIGALVGLSTRLAGPGGARAFPAGRATISISGRAGTPSSTKPGPGAVPPTG